MRVKCNARKMQCPKNAYPGKLFFCHADVMSMKQNPGSGQAPRGSLSLHETQCVQRACDTLFPKNKLRHVYVVHDFSQDVFSKGVYDLFPDISPKEYSIKKQIEGIDKYYDACNINPSMATWNSS